MKPALIVLSLAAGVLSGCAGAHGGGETTLRAALYGDAHAPRVNLSEPAYVAIFDVRPGSGNARLVYPDPGAAQVPLRQGTQTVAAARVEYDAWYAASRNGRSDAVLYMVASREPLDLSGFATTRDARASVSARLLWSKEVPEVTEALALAVVPESTSEGWTDFMIWSRGWTNDAGSLSASNAEKTERQRAQDRWQRRQAERRTAP